MNKKIDNLMSLYSGARKWLNYAKPKEVADRKVSELYAELYDAIDNERIDYIISNISKLTSKAKKLFKAVAPTCTRTIEAAETKLAACYEMTSEGLKEIA